jgi:4-hydroxy-tetrahydrodipicolinate reductase
MQRRVELIEVDEFANLSRRDSPHLLFELMGFGRPPSEFSGEGRAQHLAGEFGPPLALLAEAAGRPVDEWSATGDVAVARSTTQLAAGELPAGTVAAQRTSIVGTSAGDEVVRFRVHWYCTTDIEPAWDLRPTGWRVQVHGDAPFDIALPFPIPIEELGEWTPAYTANRPVNAIPYVCDAPPGILVTEDLPIITPAGPRPR